MDSDVAVIQAAARQTIADTFETTGTNPHGTGSWQGTTPSAVATAVWDEALPGAHAAGTAGERLATTDNTVGTNLDALVSSRAIPGDAMALTPAERTSLSGVVDSTLSGTHGAGSWASATGFAVPGDAMALTPAERTTLSGVVDTTLTGTHGAGAWTGSSASAVATAVWSEALPGAFLAGSAGERLATTDDAVGANLDAAISTRAAPGDAMALTVGERTALDAALTAAHGAGAWTGSTASAVASAVWAEDLTAELGLTTAGDMVNAVRQALWNRLESAAGAPGTMTLYLDDAVTPRATANLLDATGGGVVANAGVPARRAAFV